MRFRPLIVSLLLAGSGVVANPILPSLAHADPMTDMARERFQEGVKFYDQKQFEKARAAFLQAWALKHHPAVLLNLAQSELRSGHEADAANHFAEYLRDNTSASPMEKSEASKGLASAKAKVGEVSITAAGGAEIFVDGDPKGRAPLPGPVYVAPGSHEIEARSGAAVETASITAVAGQSTTANLSGGGGAPVAAPISEQPPAAGTSDVPPPIGDGGESAGFDVSTAGDRENFFSWYTSTPVAWALTGVGAAGLGVGIGLGIAANSDFDSANNFKQQILARGMTEGLAGPPCNGSTRFANVDQRNEFEAACQKFVDTRDSGNTKQTVSIVGLVVGAAGLAGVGVYYFIDAEKTETAKSKTRRRVGVAPVATPTTGGVAVIGQF